LQSFIQNCHDPARPSERIHPGGPSARFHPRRLRVRDAKAQIVFNIYSSASPRLRASAVKAARSAAMANYPFRIIMENQ